MQESSKNMPGDSSGAPPQAWLHAAGRLGIFLHCFPEKGYRVFLSVAISRVETVIRRSAYSSRAFTPTCLSHLTTEKLVTQTQKVPSHESMKAWRSPESLGGAVL